MAAKADRGDVVGLLSVMSRHTTGTSDAIQQSLGGGGVVNGAVVGDTVVGDLGDKKVGGDKHGDQDDDVDGKHVDEDTKHGQNKTDDNPPSRVVNGQHDALTGVQQALQHVAAAVDAHTAQLAAVQHMLQMQEQKLAGACCVGGCLCWWVLKWWCVRVVVCWGAHGAVMMGLQVVCG